MIILFSISLCEKSYTDIQNEINSKVNLEEIYFPKNDNQVEIIEGKDNKEKAAILISKLREEGII